MCLRYFSDGVTYDKYSMVHGRDRIALCFCYLNVCESLPVTENKRQEEERKLERGRSVSVTFFFFFSFYG